MLRSAASAIASDVGAPTPDENRRARHRRLLHELEGQPAADAQDVPVQRQQPVAQRAADDLVHRVVAPDVLAGEERARRSA